MKSARIKHNKVIFRVGEEINIEGFGGSGGGGGGMGIC